MNSILTTVGSASVLGDHHTWSEMPMKFSLILMVMSADGTKIDYIAAPGVWSQTECNNGGTNWMKKDLKRHSFNCIKMDGLQ